LEKKVRDPESTGNGILAVEHGFRIVRIASRKSRISGAYITSGMTTMTIESGF